jgi:hypothetical protein
VYRTPEMGVYRNQWVTTKVYRSLTSELGRKVAESQYLH